MTDINKCETNIIFILIIRVRFVLAERVSSIGKDWHRACLKCTKCGKTLSSGSHAEVIFTFKFRFHKGHKAET